MHTTTIRIQSADDVRELVNIISGCGYDVELVSGHSTVDGRSIMGIFSLDFSVPVQVRAYSDNCADFFEKLGKFTV